MASQRQSARPPTVTELTTAKVRVRQDTNQMTNVRKNSVTWTFLPLKGIENETLAKDA